MKANIFNLFASHKLSQVIILIWSILIVISYTSNIRNLEDHSLTVFTGVTQCHHYTHLQEDAIAETSAINLNVSHWSFIAAIAAGANVKQEHHSL